MMKHLRAGDRICGSCGGLNGRHRPTCTSDQSFEVISVYTRQQAIEDGILVDCEQAPMGKMRRQLLKWPLAMTATTFHRYVWPIGEDASALPGQSLEGRFWDIVWMFHCAVKGMVSRRRISPEVLLFDFYCIVSDPALCPNERSDRSANSGPQGMRRVTLKVVCGPGDGGEPVMTFMLPEEDLSDGEYARGTDG
jgi:hypothetical protein